ncbi:hypothetical protein [Streptomyces uncialis]|uniref:hypothetical protein n=1 Tax=Streptomyces uncialis TaxID=1048205 RepID=UPI002251E005|nr:hypothetical protein [Streptomyces uncialis]MCX4665058.1 hypothetical protein [Streptomyces uncialis]
MQNARQQAIENAAREVIAHGGPEALTDPRQVLNSMRTASDLGATHQDITDEMKRQRNA